MGVIAGQLLHGRGLNQKKTGFMSEVAVNGEDLRESTRDTVRDCVWPLVEEGVVELQARVIQVNHIHQFSIAASAILTHNKPPVIASGHCPGGT